MEEKAVKRPLVGCAIALGVGTYIEVTLRLSLGWWIALIGLFVCFILFFIGRGLQTGICCMFLAIGMLAAAIPMGADLRAGEAEMLQGERKVSGRVCDVPLFESSDGPVVLEDVYVDGKPIEGKVRIPKLVQKLKFEYGQRLTAMGSLIRPDIIRNPGDRNYRLAALGKGILYTFWPIGDIDIQPAEGFLIMKPFVDIRQQIAQSLTRTVGENGGLYAGVLLGNDEMIDIEVLWDFRYSGIAHLLAVSGLHVGSVVLACQWLLLLFIKSKRLRFGLTCLVLLLFCALAAFTASVVRAAIMAAMLLLGQAIGRKTDPPTTLAVAFIGILLVRPLDLFEVGFQLSFAAVAGLTLLSPAISRAFKKLKLPGALGSSLGVILAAQLSTLPVTLFYFRYISLVSILVNFLIVPLSGIILLLGFLQAAVVSAIPALGPSLGIVLNVFATGITVVVRGASQLGALIRTGPMQFWWVTPYIMALLMMSDYFPHRPPGRRWANAAVTILMILTVVVYYQPHDSAFSAVFLDVGQGNSMVMLTPQGSAIVVDTGEYGINTCYYLENAGVRAIERIYLTHADSDHAGGLLPLLDTYPVGQIIVPPRADEPDQWEDINMLAAVYNVPVKEMFDGESHQTDELSIHCWASAEGKGNDASLVLEARYGQLKLLLVGDAGEQTEQALLERGVSPIDVLLVSHHGAKGATGDEWLAALNPQLAVISVGRRNTYGHPDEGTLARIYESGAFTMRTDQQGAVTIQAWENHWKVESCIQP